MKIDSYHGQKWCHDGSYNREVVMWNVCQGFRLSLVRELG
jgi:hypothetical protein